MTGHGCSAARRLEIQGIYLSLGGNREKAAITPSMPTALLQRLFTLDLPLSLVSQSNGRDNAKGTFQLCPRDSCGTRLAPKPYSLSLGLTF